MENKDVIYKNILGNMSDGVMTIDLEGRIITFNSAAEQILGMSGEEVLNRPFAESFMLLDGSDEFNQTILDAIYEAEAIHKKIVGFGSAEKRLSLEVTTSFLQQMEGEEKKRLAVIVVFDNITETARLREAEKNLTEELRQNHKNLQDAYMKIEATNEDLKTALKKVQVARISVTIFVIILFVGIGLYSWRSTRISTGSESAPVAQTGKPGEIQTIAVQPQYVSSSISLTGELRPLNMANVISPFNGKVKERLFQYGEVVRKDQVLIRMDTSEVETSLREAKVAHIKAMEKLHELENWGQSTEMSNAKRTLARAKMSLETQKRNIEDVKGLFDKGIVSQSEYDSARQQYENQKIDYESAVEALETTRAKGDEKNLTITKLELQNITRKMEDLERQLGQADVTAPVSGTVIMPEAADKEKASIEKGKSVSQGDILISVGNMEGFSIKASIDEIGIQKIKQGQKVNVAGDAFQGTVLEGKISHVSSQAVKGLSGSVPMFEITVTVVQISPEQREILKLGMSSNLQLIIYENPQAMLIPVSAVKFDEAGKKYVNIKDKKTGELKKAEVETGTTTLDSVEILKGLQAGDEVAL